MDQWIRLCLPSCRPGFESTHTINAFSFIVTFVLFLSYSKNKNKRREPGLTHVRKQKEAGESPY